jgi:hypothetical protein
LGIVAIGGSISLKLEVVTHTTFSGLLSSAPGVANVFFASILANARELGLHRRH